MKREWKTFLIAAIATVFAVVAPNLLFAQCCKECTCRPARSAAAEVVSSPLSATVATARSSSTGVDPLAFGQWINPLRVGQGLQPLAYDQNLSDWANLNNQWCRYEVRMVHKILVGGQCVAWGRKTSGETFNQWLKSPPHLAQMLGPYSSFGISFDGMYWTLNLR